MKGKIGALVAAAAAAVGAVGAATWARRKQGEDRLELEVAETTMAPGVGQAPDADEPPVAASAGEVAGSGEVAGTSDAAGTGDAGTPATASVDDLTAIRGLGKVKVARLAAMGITTYAQIAAWTDEDIAEVGLKVNTSPGQIKREDWVGQARSLADG
jgi:predicted flap endonuclease-1-like 5' DNA nuclease